MPGDDPVTEPYDERYRELRTGFTAAVSHELRTPLARILALLDSAALPGADVHELVAQARTEVERAGELIDDILFLSELESGEASVALGSTRAYPVLRDVAGQLEDRAARAGMSIAVTGEDDLELPLRERMLRVVAQNLAENAIRYAGHDSTFAFRLEREDGRIVLTGADDGIGVSEEHLPRLFERFYRADRARTSRGSGLGLAIVKHIVVSAGGDVEARGERGRGLRVRCVFPG
jgi:two-component system phosphate regulon sensor histidine kinase PhoR